MGFFRQPESIMALHLPEFGAYARLWCATAVKHGWKEMRPITFVADKPSSFSVQYKYSPLGGSERFVIFRRQSSSTAFNLAHHLKVMKGLPKSYEVKWQEYWCTGS